MLKALAAMLLTAAHGAFINLKMENGDTQANNLEENNDEVVDDFKFLDNYNKAISVPSD